MVIGDTQNDDDISTTSTLTAPKVIHAQVSEIQGMITKERVRQHNYVVLAFL